MKLNLAAIGLWAALAAAHALFGTEAPAAEAAPAVGALPANRWVKLHECSAKDEVRPARQAHGGSCFDRTRGVLMLFGSNTHGKDWQNNPFCFDPAARTWSTPYPEDAFETYAVTPEGLPVAGKDGAHPWASHTFGAVVYDDARDEMIVACFDEHLVPGRFTPVMKDLWPKIKIRPTWVYACASKTWKAIPKGESFFPHCTAFDSDRKVTIGYRADGIFELAGEGDARAWTKVCGPVEGLTGWHTNCAYDAKQKALVVFGHHQNKNDVGVYDPATKKTRLMPTPGARPPKDQHTPMEFHPGLGKTVVLVDRTKQKDGAPADTTETWLYDLGADAWTQVPGATLPFACGMNYNLEYDPKHDALLLVTGGYDVPTAVWALKLTPDRSEK
ncbi:MAG: hypothetical protein KIS92_18155 [Planctomycetota bacterium]|nr:hypothetical protein [Planctomycetota bacterium]